MWRALFILILFPFYAQAQATQQSPIKVRKVKSFIRADFNEKTNRLVAVDKYGNTNDTAIISFHMLLSIDGLNNVDSSSSSSLTPKMAQWIKVGRNKAQIRFYRIKAMDTDGNIISLPNIVYTLRPSHNQDSD
jgi:hypothetical protein